MPIGASNIGQFANGVSVGLLEQVATTKVPDLYAKNIVFRQLISLPFRFPFGDILFYVPL
jgi:hypothetical protein